MTSPDDKTPVEQAVEHALDLFVYAPVGLLFEGASLLPQLIEKGRSQVALARMVGRFAVRHRRSEAARVVDGFHEQAAGLLSVVGGRAPVARPVRPPAATRATTRPTAAPASRSGSSRAATRPSAEAAAALAIPDYDGLSASQVVNRLAGLSAGELAAVCRYEEAHRGRKTILSKAAQLRAR